MKLYNFFHHKLKNRLNKKYYYYCYYYYKSNINVYKFNNIFYTLIHFNIYIYIIVYDGNKIM